jgi:hypothetical protein
MGETSWHGFAAAIFAGWARRGGRVPILERIRTADYPTPARRPANCRLTAQRWSASSVFGYHCGNYRSNRASTTSQRRVRVGRLQNKLQPPSTHRSKSSLLAASGCKISRFEGSVTCLAQSEARPR